MAAGLSHSGPSGADETAVSAPIFISYSSKDQDIAETIYRALEARGQNCWIACRDVKPGENYQEAIVRALRVAKVMLLVFTSNANNSDEIKKELVLAGRHRVTVVPVRVEDVVPNDAFTYELATRQWIDLFKDWERQVGILAARLGDILQNSQTGEAGNAAAAISASLPPPPAAAKPPSKQALLWGTIPAAVLIVGGGAYYLHGRTPPKPATPPSPAMETTALKAPTAPSQPPAKLAEQTPAAAPVIQAAPPPPKAPAATEPARQTAAAPPPPPPPAAPPADPDEAAWENALTAGTREAFDGYLKSFAAGVHVQEAQLRMADAIMAGTSAAKTFDGAWTTTWTCTNFSKFPGYTYQFSSEVKDGSYHAQKGKPGDPASLAIDGKIEPDGTAAFFGKGYVGSIVVALGAPRGTQYAFHALGHFEHGIGDGRRIEGRPCTMSFQKQ
jgi:TIR domain